MTASQILNDSSNEIGGNIKECDILILCNMFTLEDLYSSVNQYILNECMYKINAQGKDPLKMQDRSMDVIGMSMGSSH